jgi:Raf kinase inhibitor-like YbhB/YbcL family protein
MITLKSFLSLIFLLILVSGVLMMSKLIHASATGGNMILKTNAFKASEAIPSKYTCDGADVSPGLAWEGAPEGTRSFALICDDPDAPSGIFAHWVLFALPSTVTSLPENLPKQNDLNSPKCKQGMNDFGNVGYNGPCPPGGTHRYFFKLYALDSDIQLASKAGKRDLEAAIKGHVLAQAELVGNYRRK